MEKQGGNSESILFDHTVHIHLELYNKRCQLCR